MLSHLKDRGHQEDNLNTRHSTTLCLCPLMGDTSSISRGSLAFSSTFYFFYNRFNI